ncbi:hypothetical protein C8F01DRAFT_1377662 [Mycena amicta]|nr:hypothetical protein C8F01DRAFT_1377662 [Mycena amicta]
MGKHPAFKAIYGSLALSLYCVSVEWFLYGIYCILFFFCIAAARRNSRMLHRRALLIAVSVIFAFCTLHWVLMLVNAGKLLDVELSEAKEHMKNFQAERSLEWNRINIAMDFLYVTNNIIADGIFIFRCYGIWDCRKRIIAVPLIMLAATACLGYAGVIVSGIKNHAEFLFMTPLFPLAIVFSVLTNTILVALTAGRIWWIARSVRAIMGPTVVHQYRTVIAMILESGALYVTPGILYLILLVPETAATQVILSALTQIVGIAPTIIVARVGLGNSINNCQSFQEVAIRDGTVLDIGAFPVDEHLDSKSAHYV